MVAPSIINLTSGDQPANEALVHKLDCNEGSLVLNEAINFPIRVFWAAVPFSS